MSISFFGRERRGQNFRSAARSLWLAETERMSDALARKMLKMAFRTTHVVVEELLVAPSLISSSAYSSPRRDLSATVVCLKSSRDDF